MATRRKVADVTQSSDVDDDRSDPVGRLTPTIGLEEAGKLLRCSPDTVRKMAKAGEIPGTKVGRAWVFYTEQLLEWVAARCRAGPPQRSLDGGSALASRLAARLAARREERVAESKGPRRKR